jgi:hypothetical protein
VRFGALAAAQKLVSAANRAPGRFFLGHSANRLVGRAAAALKRHGHGLFPAFAASKELNSDPAQRPKIPRRRAERWKR